MFSFEKIRHSFVQIKHLHRFLALGVCAALIVTGSVIFGDTAKIIRIADGEKDYMVRSFSGNIPAALQVAGLRSDNYRIVSSETTANTTSVNIEYLFPVYITVGDDTVEYETSKSTVGEILADAGYSVDEFDLIYPEKDTKVKDTVYIDYTNIDYVTGEYTEAISRGTVTVKNNALAIGTEKLEQGKDGVQKVTYTEKYVNGKKTETTVNSKVVLTAAVDDKRIVGTKKTTPQTVKTSNEVNCVSTLKPNSPIELDANGVPVNYTKRITARATAYTYTGNNTSQ